MGLLDDAAPGMGLLGAAPQRFAPGLLNNAPPQGGMARMMFDPQVRDWYRSFIHRFGEPPQLGPEYATEKAYDAGLRPQPYEGDNGLPHWPSKTPSGEWLKAPDHETRWMQTFMERYGVDPNQAPPEIILDALRTGVMPGPLTMSR